MVKSDHLMWKKQTGTQDIFAELVNVIHECAGQKDNDDETGLY